MARYTLLVQNYNSHVSEDTLQDLEEELKPYAANLLTKKFNISSRLKSKVLNKLFSFTLFHNLFKKIFETQKLHLAVVMGVNFQKCNPEFIMAKGNFVFFFDAWPKNHFKIREFIQKCNVKIAFFSSRQVAELFSKENPQIKSCWVPEGVNVNKFLPHNSVEKTNDIIQYGRKYEAYHKMIEGKIQLSGYSYLYQRSEKEVLFPDSFTFCEELCKSKISICFPSSITHPERSGDINTMTVRYLESMISRCLIVGKMPPEMADLFDYCPIIEVDFANPFKQLEFLLKNYDDYQDLIDRNYKQVLNNHTWKVRARDISNIISSYS